MPFRLRDFASIAVLLSGLVFFQRDVGAAERSQWFARPWQTEDGLPNNTVFGIVQTPDGYLWLGTPTGLVRFDGASFEEFSSTNFVERPNRGILCMAPLRSGGIGVAMDRGAVVLLRHESVRVFRPGRDLPDAFPYSILEDARGSVWVSYRDGSICRIDDQHVTRFGEEGTASPSTNMYTLAVDNKGVLWAASGSRFGRFREGHFELVRRLPSSATRLASARDGGIWICSGTQLLKAQEDGEVTEVAELPMPRPSIAPTALLEDQAGGVWVGTAYSGLYHVSGTNSEKIPIAHEEVLSLAEDFEGSVWVGTTGDGLYQIRPRVVDLERTEEGLPFEAVQSLCEDTSGVIWAATQNGALARRFGERWQFFSPAESWPGQASCVAAGPDGIVWIGTRMTGLYCWQHDRLVNWGNADDLVGRTIHTLQATRTGDLWIGEDSPNALQRLRAGKLTTLAVPSENMRVIRAMTEDAEDAIWAGTSRGVLLRTKDGQVTDKTVRSGDEPPPSIRCLYTSPDGAVWVGYASGYGLGRIKNGHVARIRSDQGLFDDGISHIIADDRGWLWFGSDRGIFKARQRELDDVADGRAERVRSIHYGRGEGLPSLQANFGGAPGALRSRDGRIWIPMRAALAIIYPNRLRENLTPPPVLVHRVSVDEQTAALYSGAVPTSDRRNQQIIDLRATNAVLRLAPSHRRLEFEFTALSFAAPENVHFRYELENFDDDWTEGNNVDRSASYSRLPAGHYKFRVVACNSDGVWNQAGAVLEIVVRPFAWQTWWFQTGTVLAFTGLVIAAVRYVSFRRLRLQLRRLEEQEALHKERARIAKDIHDDVGANLTQIALLGDLARQDGESGAASASRMDTISNTARQAVKSLDEIVWAVNPRNDTLAHLIDYTGQFAVDYLRPVGIRCRLDLPDQTPSREISTDVRHNLFLVVKEALNNVVKHAKATEVWLRVAVNDAGLQVCVEDNGRGFDEPPQREDADGLRNMRQRCRDIGGECRIESCSGGGTKVRVDLPWPAAKT